MPNVIASKQRKHKPNPILNCEPRGLAGQIILFLSPFGLF
jgi:hypothetical protein